VEWREDDGGFSDEDARGIWRTLIYGGWPRHLVKAVFDHYSYRVKLRTGEVMDFEFAESSTRGDWVRLFGVAGEEHWPERGVDVRVSDIVWIADASS
jgi:hypothetical protein